MPKEETFIEVNYSNDSKVKNSANIAIKIFDGAVKVFLLGSMFGFFGLPPALYLKEYVIAMAIGSASAGLGVIAAGFFGAKLVISEKSLGKEEGHDNAVVPEILVEEPDKSVSSPDSQSVTVVSETAVITPASSSQSDFLKEILAKGGNSKTHLEENPLNVNGGLPFGV